MSSSKYCILTSLLVLGILAIAVTAKPKPSVNTSKIRIHVPVKHHTHIHTLTKTIIKEVHVPKKPHSHHESDEQPPPLKYQKPKHHRLSEEVDHYDDMSDEYVDLYPKPKPKKFHHMRHPFY